MRAGVLGPGPGRQPLAPTGLTVRGGGSFSHINFPLSPHWVGRECTKVVCHNFYWVPESGISCPRITWVANLSDEVRGPHLSCLLPRTSSGARCKHCKGEVEVPPALGPGRSGVPAGEQRLRMQHRDGAATLLWAAGVMVHVCQGVWAQGRGVQLGHSPFSVPFVH